MRGRTSFGGSGQIPTTRYMTAVSLHSYTVYFTLVTTTFKIMGNIYDSYLPCLYTVVGTSLQRRMLKVSNIECLLVIFARRKNFCYPATFFSLK